ncbi:MAG: glycosyltransferase family 4 protein [Arcicella sp.]|nr:glycosyltransferase family 4 protein [Arcicella sp.]
MKVLIIHNQLWAHYKAIIFNELQELIIPNKEDSLLVIQIATIEKSRVNLGDLDNTIHQYPYKLLHDGILEDVGLWQRITGIIKAIRVFKPDIVNLTGYYDYASWAVLFYCKMSSIKTILSNESTADDHARNKFKEFFKSLIIKQFDGYFNFGTLSKNYLLGLGAKSEKMLANRNCVDNKALKSIYQNCLPKRIERQKSLNLASKNFIFVGRLIDYKNLFLFLEAFRIAQSKLNEDWGIIILGDGEQKSDLQQFVKEKDIQHVCFQQGVSFRQVPEYLALSNALVLPSYSEPWGLVVNEAMACGLPVIVSEKCGCAIDLIKNGENGYIFSPNNVEQLTTILLKFMNQEVDLKQMGQISEKIIREYSPENVAVEMYEGYKRLNQ